MTAQDLQPRLERVHPLQILVAVFQQKGIAGLTGMLRLHQRAMLEIHPDDMLVVIAVVASRTWDRDANRRVRFSVRADPQMIAEGIAESLERLEIFSDHDLKALMTGSIPRRAAAVAAAEEKFIKPWMAELHGFGISTKLSFTILPGNLPFLEVEVLAGSETIGKVGLDGWSGRMQLPDGSLSRELATPALVQKYLLGLVEAYSS